MTRLARPLRLLLATGLAAIALAALAPGCARATRNGGGLMLVFEADAALAPDTMHVTVASLPDGAIRLDWCYPITSPATFFPTTLAVASNGDPAATFIVTASVLRAGVTLDVRRDEVSEVPVDRVGELTIHFSENCTAQVGALLDPLHGNQCTAPSAVSLCPPGETCNWASGRCVSDAINGTELPPFEGLDAASGSASGSASGASAGTSSGSVITSGATTGTVAASGTVEDAATDASALPDAGGTGPPPDATTSRRSAGCGVAPPPDAGTAFIDYDVTIPGCTGSGRIYPDCIVDAFAPGGVAYASYGNATNGKTYDYEHRDYTVVLPANYDPQAAYPVFFGAGGCGGTPPLRSGGFNLGATNAIRIGLSYVNICFADGGLTCASPAANLGLCAQNPEVPYLKAVLDEVEARYCIDTGRVFAGGYESGAFEAQTMACALGNRLRGVLTADGGGAHVHRPPCTGPVAALMVQGLGDTETPVGPLAPDVIDMDTGVANGPYSAWDSAGTVSGRDDLLQRNGCVGTATAPYDASHPACVRYTGCPSEYPVVWCPLPGAGLNQYTYGGVSYFSATDALTWPFLSGLPGL
jgi:polyhydroxybutyrate depolymerase